MPEKSNGPTYTIAHKLSAHNNEASCNKGSEKSCGSYTWKIPQSVKSGDYSVEIHSLHDKTVYGECTVGQSRTSDLTVLCRLHGHHHHQQETSLIPLLGSSVRHP